MMRRLAYLILLAFLACTAPKDKRPELLAAFLQEDLGLSQIDFKQKNKIILVPEFGCKGCITQVVIKMIELCEQGKLPDNVWVVYCSAKYKNGLRKCSQQAIYDSAAYIADLRVKIMNVSGYEIDNGKVVREEFALTEKPDKFIEFVLH